MGVENNGIGNDNILNSGGVGTISNEHSLNAPIVVDNKGSAVYNEMEIDMTFNQESTAMDARDIIEPSSLLTNGSNNNYAWMDANFHATNNGKKKRLDWLR